MKRLLLTALLIAGAACDGQRGMETRTFQLHRLSNEEAVTLITPYVQNGTLSTRAKSKLVTVREKPERLNVIEDLLRRYDGMGEVMDLVLDVQIIEANGFTTRDSAIADIEQTLRETFRYRGYRLAGEARIQAREGTNFRRSIGKGFVLGQNSPGYMLEGGVDRLRTVNNQQPFDRVPIEIRLQGPTGDGGIVELGGTVTGIIGKPTVMGQSTGDGAIILVIRPSVAAR